jgi:hypothetical protein
LPQWLVEWLRSQPIAASVLIEDALREVHGLTPPKDAD